MPIYEYKCKECKSEFDFWFRTFAEVDEIIPMCPECKSIKVKRIYKTPCEHHLKGSGFHKTDYTKTGRKSSEVKSAATKPVTPTGVQKNRQKRREKKNAK